MGGRRIKKGVERSPSFEIRVDGVTMRAHEGETIAAVLMAGGVRTLRSSPENNEPRGVYCGIGLCHDCLVNINGMPNQRACQTLATPGCRVNTQQGLGSLDENP